VKDLVEKSNHQKSGKTASNRTQKQPRKETVNPPDRRDDSIPQSGINNSPTVVAQRMQLAKAFGEAVQRQQREEEEEELLQGKFTLDSNTAFQEKTNSPPNKTGLPDNLKAGIESLSGIDMSDVRVQRNSSKPAQLNALAYTQGNEIHLGPEQERHLPHEAWHAVQQKQGRVKPSTYLHGKAINDNPDLEQDADTMGEKAKSMKANLNQDEYAEPRGVKSPVTQLINTAVEELLDGMDGYREDRNYMVWGNTDDLPHVGWKAHIGANIEQSAAMAGKIAPILCAHNFAHKFDILTDEGYSPKFITIYPPEDENDWAGLITELANNLGDFENVKIDGNMRVGKKGRVRMRYGQITRLTTEMATGLITEDGKIGEYPHYSGDAIESGGLPLLSSGTILFFSKTQEAPQEIDEEYIYMAIRINDKIVPDKREKANPNKMPLPPGVGKYWGCFITTACVRARGLPDDCEELTVLRAFRDGFLSKSAHGRELIERYYQLAPTIVEAINSENNSGKIYAELYQIIKSCVNAIKDGRSEEAIAIYRNMTNMLAKKYLSGKAIC